VIESSHENGREMYEEERREGARNLYLGKLARSDKSRDQVQAATGVGVEHISYP
jgi:hypothetical protein